MPTGWLVTNASSHCSSSQVHETPGRHVCVWGGAAAELRAAGHDVVWSGDWSEDPGDDEILTRAYDDNRVLVTLDKSEEQLDLKFF